MIRRERDRESERENRERERERERENEIVWKFIRNCMSLKMLLSYKV